VAEGGELEGEALVYKIAVKLCVEPQSEGDAFERRDIFEVAAGGEGDAKGEDLATPGPTRQPPNTPHGRDGEGAREREWRDALIEESRRKEQELLRTQELLGRARSELERARGDVDAMRAAHEEALSGAKGRSEELEEALRGLRGELEEEAARGRSSRDEVLRIKEEMRLLEEELGRARSQKEEEVARLTRAGEAVAESRSQLCDDLRVMEQVKALDAHICSKWTKAAKQSIDPSVDRSFLQSRGQKRKQSPIDQTINRSLVQNHEQKRKRQHQPPTTNHQPPTTNRIQELEEVLRERDAALKQVSYLRGERDALEARASDFERERTAACAALCGAEEGIDLVQKQADVLRSERDEMFASLEGARAERWVVPPGVYQEFCVFSARSIILYAFRYRPSECWL
jgi:chromosome segregation ATPase